jgi:FkbM family methyltransferase
MENFFNLIENVKGVIQIGANSGQEVNFILGHTKNVILIEPIPTLAESLSLRYPNCKVIKCALGSTDCEMDFHLASNNGESSSLLKPLKHVEYYPEITFNHTIKVPVRKFTTIAEDYEIDVDSFNVIISDTQGYDLECLKGFGENITKFDLIISEYINSNLYENDGNLQSFIDYLIPFGFEFVSTFSENIGAGNVIFKKNKQ